MTTFVDSHAAQLQDLVTCAICSDHYQDPRCLPCSHTFCYLCINNAVKDGSFICPLNDETKIDHKDVSDLLINHKVADMVELVSSVNLPTNKKSSHECDNCSVNEATNWCEKCTSHFCQSCTDSIHSIKIFKSHIIIPLENKTESFCLKHSDEKIKYWCKKCEVLVCRECLLFQHKDHTFTSLKEAASEIKMNLQETAPEIDEIKQNLTMFLETTTDIISEHHAIAEQQKQRIEQAFANLQRILDERKLAIIKQLEDNNLQTTNILNERHSSIDQHRNLTIVQELCLKKILDSADPMQILKFKSTLSHNCKDFTEQYKKIEEGYNLTNYIFENDDIDVEKISGIVSKLGKIKSQSYPVKRDGLGIIRLDISIRDGVTKSTEKTINYARGYKFSLTQPFELHSIRIQSDYSGQHIGFVINEANVVISNSIINSKDSTMKWLTIPLKCEIRNNYSVFVWAPSGNGSYIYKPGNNVFRTVDQSCSVESKGIQCEVKTGMGSTNTISQNMYSIDMILNIEK